MRRTMTFKVPVTMIDGGTKWLGPAGDVVDSESDAAAFTFHRSPTGLDRVAISREVHRILGRGDEARGLGAWADLVKGIDVTLRASFASVESELWPGGRPQVKEGDKEAEAAQAKAFSSAYAASTCSEKLAHRSLREQIDQVLWMARWNVLAVSVPPFFRDLSGVELEDEVLWSTLEIAWHNARHEAEATSGKQGPSAS